MMSLNGRLSESPSADDVDLSDYDYIITPCPRQDFAGESSSRSYASLDSARHTYELTLPFAKSFRVSRTNRFYSGTFENLSHAPDEDLSSSLLRARDLLSNSYNFEEQGRTDKVKSKPLQVELDAVKTHSDTRDTTITRNLDESKKITLSCTQGNGFSYSSLVSCTPKNSEEIFKENPLRSLTEWRKTSVQNDYDDLSTPDEARPRNTRNTVRSFSPKSNHFTSNSAIQKTKKLPETSVIVTKLLPEDDSNLWSRDPRCSGLFQNNTDDELSECNQRGVTSNILLAKHDSSRLTPLDSQLDLDKEHDHGRELSKTSQFLRHVPPAQSPKTRLQRQYYQVHVLGELKDFLPILSELKNDEITSSLSRDSWSRYSASSSHSERFQRENLGGKDGQQGKDKFLDHYEYNSVGTSDPAELEWRSNYDHLIKELKHKTIDGQSRQISAQAESETTPL